MRPFSPLLTSPPRKVKFAVLLLIFVVSFVFVIFPSLTLTASSTSPDDQQQFGSPAVNDGVPICPKRPPRLKKKLNVTFEAPSFEEIARRNPDLEKGGRYKPKECQPNGDRLAIVIPYRKRDAQLRAVINHLHPILQRQQLDYTIFVVEQGGDEIFNRGLLMNIGFKESQRLAASDANADNFECYVFHDVDLFAQDDRGLHVCGANPLHLSEYIDKFGYRSWQGADVLFGGVVSMAREIVEVVNGFSTVFFGWGGEDEEMRFRLRHYAIPVAKPEKAFYRYKMMKHVSDQGNPKNNLAYELVQQTSQRMYQDGLNSMRYQLLATSLRPTHTHFLVNFSREDIFRSVFGVGSITSSYDD